jgi:hypothetical protein
VQPAAAMSDLKLKFTAFVVPIFINMQTQATNSSLLVLYAINWQMIDMIYKKKLEDGLPPSVQLTSIIQIECTRLLLDLHLE